MIASACRRWLGLCCVCCLFIANCATTAPQEFDEDAVKGTITISGAWALYPLMVRWSDEFQSIYPDVRIDVSAGGAGKGMSDVLAGVVDIGMVSREIYPEEIEKGAFWIPVTKDAVFLTVNAGNPVWQELRRMGLTREQLIGIYITGTITNWGQLVDRPEVTDAIHVFTRSDAAGAPATIAEYFGGLQEDLLGIGVYGDPGLLEAVIQDPLGIGYNNLNYAFDTDTGLPVLGAQVIPLDLDQNRQINEQETLDTKEQAIGAVSTGTYPSPPARELNLVTLNQPSGLTRFFLMWVLHEGQAYVGEAGYVPLLPAKLEEAIATIE
jgi:phosphate transport system substrate-binding protein